MLIYGVAGSKVASPFWVNTGSDARIAIVACPAGGERLSRAMSSIRAAGVDVLVSLQTPSEMQALGLQDEPQECERAGMRFLWLPVVDHRVPSSATAVFEMVEVIEGELAAGNTVAAHCFAGVGRSVVLLACVLCALGWTVDAALDALSVARGFQVPETEEQVRWVQAFAAMLKVPGSLTRSRG